MPLGRRRPIARMAVTTAVVAGTATAVSGRVARRQERRYGGQQQAPPPEAAAPPPPPEAAAPAPEGNTEELDDIRGLAELHSQGILTDEEFAAKKAQILGL